MKRTCLLLLAALELTALAALASSRPRYGGVLRVEARGSLRSLELDPADRYADRVALRDEILASVGNTLLTVDARGTVRPSLASSWRTEREGRRWLVSIRRGVSMHNGGQLTPQMAITVLAAANPAWRLRLEGEDVLIESEATISAAELAEPHNSIVVRGDGGNWIGTGPFYVFNFEPEKRVVLRAFEDCWAGRPFLDRIELTMGRNLRDQAADQELGKADLVEADITQPRSSTASATLAQSQPVEALLLVFSEKTRAADDPRLREAIAASLDRTSINNVLLRRQTEPTASLLPNWISGYTHLFPAAQDLERARQRRAEVSGLQPLTLAYDSADPLGKSVADRIAVNAREAGIFIQTYGELFSARAPSADMRLERLHLGGSDARSMLLNLGTQLGNQELQHAREADSLDELFRAEQQALKSFKVVPIAYLPQTFIVSPTVHDFALSPFGNQHWDEVWLEGAKP